MNKKEFKRKIIEFDKHLLEIREAVRRLRRKQNE